MLQILTKIPLFVWPLLALLIWGGLKARKSNAIPLILLFTVPVPFFIWSLMTFFGKFGTHTIAVGVWLVCLGTGGVLGFLQMQRLRLQFDRQKRSVHLPGSWIPLILSLSLFSSKFTLGMLGGIFPHLSGSNLFLGLELLAVLILGVFLGRAGCCCWRYKRSYADESVNNMQHPPKK